MSLLDKIWLWWHDYCPKHATLKHNCRGGGMSWKLCTECAETNLEKSRQKKLAREAKAEEIRKKL